MTTTTTTAIDSNPSRRRFLRLAAILGGALAAGSAVIEDAAAASGTPANPVPSGDAIVPFRVAVPQAALDDLKLRLRMVRWPEKETVGDWSQGVPLAKARALVDHWRDRYDWRKLEARLNAHPQFRTSIDGLAIHFIHVKSRHANALPILLTHGWPGSIVEFLDVIGPLTDPTRYGGKAEDAFHVVIPSMPGFGFSDKPHDTGWDVVRTAKAWGVLMARLGYGKWVAQGGDWGSGVTHALGHVRPRGLAAAHVNWPLVFPEQMPASPTPEEQAAYAAAGRFANEEFGYFKEQATRPQTVGYALADSPVGQALWIYEKFQAWTDNRGNPEDALSMDAMLDDITLYWLTNTGASSARIYWQNSQGKPAGFSAGRIELPMAATIFPHEIYRVPKAWAQALWPNMIYWNEVDRGGHFAAFEQPRLFAEEMRKAFISVR
jgi:pimeloyl-ACP methyl ester carboxylesterase